jgi:hypothetical protein
MHKSFIINCNTLLHVSPLKTTQYTVNITSHSTIKCNLSVTITKSFPWRWPSRVETCRSVLQLMIKLSSCIVGDQCFCYNTRYWPETYEKRDGSRYFRKYRSPKYELRSSFWFTSLRLLYQFNSMTERSFGSDGLARVLQYWQRTIENYGFTKKSTCREVWSKYGENNPGFQSRQWQDIPLFSF